MNNHEEHPKTKPSKTDLKSAVLSRIKEEKVCPKSKFSFLCINCLVWAFWIITVVIGAIAVSEAIYMSMHAGFEFFDITHGGLTPFIIDSLPYVWLLAFAVMVVLAYFNLRQTRRGYRYPLWQIIASSLVFTIAGGAVLNAAGVNMELDRMMDEMVPSYTSAEEWQEYLWLDPEGGRLTGTYVATVNAEQQVRFSDAAGNEWVLVVHELSPEHFQLLSTGQRVRIIGESDKSQEKWVFYTCGVLPWMPKSGHTFETLRASRTEVQQMLAQYVPTSNTSADATTAQPSLRCREIVQHVFHKNY